MNNLDKQYHDLLRILLLYGVDKSDRTGTGTKSIFGYQIRHNMAEGFPLLTTKKIAVKTMMTELKWFLKGDTNIKYLVDNGCNIWNGDAYKNYASIECNPPHDHSLSKSEFIEKIKTNDEFAEEWGELGPIYGAQWKKWDGIDQIQEIINTLKTNPDSRRMLVSAWNVNYLDEMTLPPCHYGFQLYTRELNLDERIDYYNNNWSKSLNKSTDFFHEHMDDYGVPRRGLSLMWNQRSVDTFLGLPFNIASYGTLLLLLAQEARMVPGHLIGSLGDVHLYNNHIEQAYEQLGRAAFKLPEIRIDNVDILNGEFDYQILGYKSHTPIKAPLSN